MPYEIGFSRAADKTVSFLVLDTVGEKLSLPEYARIAAVYWSVDELARWASTLNGHNLHTDLTHVPKVWFEKLAQYVRLDPPEPELIGLCERALDTISLLSNPEIHSVLALTSENFDWLPTDGGAVREIAYDLLAPLAYYRLGLQIETRMRELIEAVYLSPTQHYELSRQEPRIPYQPEICGWRITRYQTPEQTWLQGLRRDQLDERIERFLMTRDRNNRLRLATKEEFKAEFDRVLASRDERSRRSLGVLVNSLFGFTPDLRPVYWRVLALQHYLFSVILGRDPDLAPFDEETRLIVRRFVK